MSVSVLLARVLVDAVEAHGIARAQLFEAAAVAPSLVDDGVRRLELADYDALQLAALSLTGDSALGLHAAERATLASVDVVGPLCLCARTLRDALGAFIRYHRLLRDCADPALVERDGRATFRYEFLRSSPQCSRMRAEFGLAMIIGVAKAWVGKETSPFRIRFEHPRPEHEREYERIFGGAAEFDQPFTGLEFDAGLLDRPQLYDNRSLYACLQAQAEIRLRQLCSRSLRLRLREMLIARGPAAPPTLEDAAAQLGMRVRTLRRRLLAEGVTYSMVTAEAQATIAKQLLGDPARSIDAVADAMGYSQASAFYRAFRKWTGLTPRKYRRLQPIFGEAEAALA